MLIQIGIQKRGFNAGRPEQHPLRLATADVANATISLTPASQSGLIGQTASLTATARTVSGAPFNGAVTFSITSGPNAGTTANVATNPNTGVATYTYSSTKAGTDHITASFNNSVPETSGEATVPRFWSSPMRPIRSGPERRSARCKA